MVPPSPRKIRHILCCPPHVCSRVRLRCVRRVILVTDYLNAAFWLSLQLAAWQGLSFLLFENKSSRLGPFEYPMGETVLFDFNGSLHLFLTCFSGVCSRHSLRSCQSATSEWFKSQKLTLSFFHSRPRQLAVAYGEVGGYLIAELWHVWCLLSGWKHIKSDIEINYSELDFYIWFDVKLCFHPDGAPNIQFRLIKLTITSPSIEMPRPALEDRITGLGGSLRSRVNSDS